MKRATAASGRIACVMGLAIGVAWSGAAFAQEAVLKFATTNAPTAHLNREVLTPWAEGVNKAAKGVVRIDLIHGAALADHNNFYTRVINDVVQISWGLPAIIAGQFPLTNVASLPFLTETSEHASTALWRVYAAGGLAKEYADVTVLGFAVFPQSALHARRPLLSLDEVKGLKVRVGDSVGAAIVLGLGAAPVSMAPSEIYQGMAKGTIDAVLVPYTAFQPFKLAEVTTHHVDASLGGSVGMVFMARKKFDSLSPAAKAVLVEHSGEAFTRRFGAFWDRIQAQARSDLVKSAKHTVTVVSATEAARHGKAMSAVTEQWTKDTPGGEAALQTFRAALTNIAAGK